MFSCAFITTATMEAVTKEENDGRKNGYMLSRDFTVLK